MKERINIIQAEQRLYDTLKENFEDRIYEFVQERFQEGIAKVEEKAEIVGLSGELYDDGTGGEPTWYDNLWQGFWDECVQAIKYHLKDENS